MYQQWSDVVYMMDFVRCFNLVCLMAFCTSAEICRVQVI